MASTTNVSELPSIEAFLAGRTYQTISSSSPLVSLSTPAAPPPSPQTVTREQYLSAYRVVHTWMIDVKSHTVDKKGIEDTVDFLTNLELMKDHLVQYIHVNTPLARSNLNNNNMVYEFDANVITWDDMITYWIHSPQHHKQVDIDIDYSLFELVWLTVCLSHTAKNLKRIILATPDISKEEFRRTTSRLRHEYSNSTLDKKPLLLETAIKRMDEIVGYTVYVMSHPPALHFISTDGDYKAKEKQIMEKHPVFANEIKTDKKNIEEEEAKNKKELLGITEWNDSERKVLDPVKKKMAEVEYVTDRVNTVLATAWSNWIPWMCMASMSYYTTQYLFNRFHVTTEYVFGGHQAFQAIRDNIPAFIKSTLRMEDLQMVRSFTNFVYENVVPFGAMEWYLRDQNRTQPNYDEVVREFHSSSKKELETRLNKSMILCYESKSTHSIESVVDECAEWAAFRSRMHAVDGFNIDLYMVGPEKLLNRIPDLLNRFDGGTSIPRRPFFVVLEGRYYIHWFPPFAPVRPYGELIDGGSLKQCIAIWIHLIYFVYGDSFESKRRLTDRWPGGLFDNVK